MAPAIQAQYLLGRFSGSELVLSTFVNDNVHNTWMLKQGDVTLLVDESDRSAMNEIELTLGKSSHAERRTGDVRSETVRISYDKPSRNVGEINEAKRDALQATLGSQSGDVYEAFVGAFGEATIRSDNRETNEA